MTTKYPPITDAEFWELSRRIERMSNCYVTITVWRDRTDPAKVEIHMTGACGAHTTCYPDKAYSIAESWVCDV